MLLDTTTKSLEVKLAGTVQANQLPIVAFYADHASGSLTPAANDTQTNNATAVTAIAAPAAATQRQIRTISIHNADTQNTIVTVQLNNNSTIRLITVQTLLPGETLFYDANAGWRILPNLTALPGYSVQTVNTQTGAVATGTTVLPFDDTIPQSNEGDQYMSLAITPNKSTNKLKIEVVILASNNYAGAHGITMALFQDDTANALASMSQQAAAQSYIVSLTLTHYMTAGTTSSTTFKVRVGGNGAGTTTFNGVASARIFGGVLASSITITEIEV